MANKGDTGGVKKHLVRHQEWRLSAACRDFPLPNYEHLWFYDVGNARNKQAAAICAACPVQTECLDFAIDNNERGYWAGTTEDERRTIRRRRKRLERLNAAK